MKLLINRLSILRYVIQFSVSCFIPLYNFSSCVYIKFTCMHKCQKLICIVASFRVFGMLLDFLMYYGCF
jgi:hypothetical protein